MIACEQELFPTSDTALVKSLMNLIDCLTDEFYDETKLQEFSERETSSWLEVVFPNWFILRKDTLQIRIFRFPSVPLCCWSNSIKALKGSVG